MIHSRFLVSKLFIVGIFIGFAFVSSAGITVGIQQFTTSSGSHDNLLITYTADQNYNTNPAFKWNSQVFTLKWSTTLGNAVINTIMQPSGCAFNFALDGSPIDGGDNFYYQKFTDAGSNIQQSISNGQTLNVLIIHVTHPTISAGTFTLVTNPNLPQAVVGGTASVNNALFNEQFVGFSPSVATNVPLPLTLIDFTAKPQKESISLLWQTANEINFTGFELQRSVNDAKNFASIAEIKGKGAGDYTYTDFNVAPADIYYYRLKMLDNDGTFTYSNIKSGNIEGKTSVKIYPNPTNNSAHLLINTVSESDVIVKVYNMAGQLMRNFSSKLITGQNDLLIDLSTFPTGMYFVLTNIKNEQFSLKLNKE